jgi:putative chitinase
MSLFARFFAWITRRPVEGVAAPAAVKDAAATEGQGLRPLLAAAGFGDVGAWAAALARPMRERGITGPRRVAAFLATVAHESNGGRALVENLNYSASRIVAVWPRRFPTVEAAQAVARNPEALAEAVYGGRMGNMRSGYGARYIGRGLIMITGADNYRAAAAATGLPLLDQPEIAAEPEAAAAIAAWWWSAHGCNELADAGEVEPWRRRVNGGLIGLADVRRRYHDVLAALGAEVLSA